ncbi:MAG TPA: PilZ domain-containing protein [Methylomirabilota bacterium]|jgi:PilZ domain-containing protein|nr:PilZ domain-containing protein [Methylomirabilota bacterium]
MRPTASKTFDPDQEQRRCPRQRVSWLVTVAAGSKSFQGLTRDVSATGAKILLKERPALGAEVSLAFRPPGRRPIATRALVWRVDPDGLACMFVGTQEADFLAAVAPRTASPPRSAPPRPAPPPRSVTVPAPPPPTPAVAPAQRSPVGTVLLATADTGLRALALAGLERERYTVLDAGPQPLLALRMAEQHGSVITLALVAAELKLMNGEPLTRRLGPLLPSAKLLLVSSRTAPSPAGPGELWLPTPCSDAELMSAVRQAHIV